MTTNKTLFIALILLWAYGMLGCAGPCREFSGADWFRTAQVVDVPVDASDDGSSGPDRSYFNRFSIRRDALEAVPSIPFTFDRWHDHLPVTTAHAILSDGTEHSFSLLVDTGATSDAVDLASPISISGRLAKALNARLLVGSTVYLTGDPSGRSVGVDAVLEHVNIGRFQIKNALASVNLGRVSSGYRPDGLLGLDFLRAFDVVVFDWEAQRIWLARSEWAEFDLAGWTGVPMLNTRSDGQTLVSIEARFGEHTFPALLDTGASVSLVPVSVFDAIPNASRRPVIVGTASVTIRGVKARSPHPIEIGSITFPVRFVTRRERITDFTDDGRAITALIGMDVLRQRSFAFDFKRNTVWFAPEVWQGPPKVVEFLPDAVQKLDSTP